MLKKIIKFHNFRSFSHQAESKSHSLFSLQDAHIKEAVNSEPALASISKDLWVRTHDIFANHGIKTESFFRIVVGNPNLLTRHPNKIVESFETWRSCQFGEKLFHLLITKYPSLLDVADSHKLLTQVTYIKGYVGSTKNIWKLLMNSPQIVNETEHSIDKRFKYLQRKMRIEVPEIVKSEVFARPIDHLMTRHVFLERLGLFKPRSIRADPNEPSKNPRLYQIVDSSDKGFSTKIAGVTQAEWDAFQELYRRELDGIREQEVEEVDEDDDDEEEEDL